MGFFKKLGKKIKKGIKKIGSKIKESPIASFAVGAGIGVLGSVIVGKLKARGGNPTVSPAGRSFATGAAKILSGAQNRGDIDSDVIGGFPGEGRTISGETAFFRRPAFRTAAIVVGGIGVVGAIIIAVKVL